MLRSGTSIGTNVSEASGVISKADFSGKISIAYNVFLETRYWLSFVSRTCFIENQMNESLYIDADQIGKILFATLKTQESNQLLMRTEQLSAIPLYRYYLMSVIHYSLFIGY